MEKRDVFLPPPFPRGGRVDNFTRTVGIVVLAMMKMLEEETAGASFGVFGRVKMEKLFFFFREKGKNETIVRFLWVAPFGVGNESVTAI